MRQPKPPIDTSPYRLEIGTEEGVVSWSAVFGDDRPVELEVGSGKGLFLQNAALSRPDHNFLGIEIARKYAGKTAERLAKHGLANARIFSGDAGRFLARNVATSSLVAVHVYFPDPWWKARHKKRRVFNATLLGDLARVLRPGGELHVATDVEEYFGVIRELVGTDPRFEELPPPELHAPEHPNDYLTNFERKYRLEGRPIFRTLYRVR